ncbi:MAG: hypothetical protein KGK08_09700 [Acidobacteriota bacterium]|nr:hypothetical protein [Acidobacteriota bacterium]
MATINATNSLNTTMENTVSDTKDARKLKVSTQSEEHTNNMILGRLPNDDSIYSSVIESYRPLARPYLDAHAKNKFLTEAEVALFGIGRLEWLVSSTYSELSDKFTESELLTLMNCIIGGPLSIQQIDALPSLILENYGIEVDDYESTPFAPLVNKICRLTPLQRLALVDAAERIFHDLGRTDSLQSSFTHYGIKLLSNK